ncbi:MAG: peptidoglycan DD-metalloendopeptidase family protein [Alphaproteobacteria bacterium]
MVAGCLPTLPRLWAPNPPVAPAQAPPAAQSADRIRPDPPAEAVQVAAAPTPEVEVASIAPPPVLEHAASPPPAPREPAPQPRLTVRPSGDEVIVPAGKTLYAIARDNDVAVRDLIELNGLEPPYHLRAGQRLKVPTERTYLVQPGDTLYSVARRMGVDLHTLVQRNDLEPPYVLVAGARIKLPPPVEPLTEPTEEAPSLVVVNAAPRVPRPPEKPIVRVSRPPAETAERPAQMAEARRSARAAEPPPRTGNGFYWPVQGKVVSRFGKQGGGVQHDGIVIAAPRGAPVRASENGVVAYAGSDLKAYGKLLLIRHADGWMTAYAHNDELLVGEGDVVRRGDTIAHAGGTSGGEQAQTYFEIRRRGKPVDPLTQLTEG